MIFARWHFSTLPGATHSGSTSIPVEPARYLDQPGVVVEVTERSLAPSLLEPVIFVACWLLCHRDISDHIHEKIDTSRPSENSNTEYIDSTSWYRSG